MATRPRRVNLTTSMNRSAIHMLRNLALPVFILFTMSLTGCQSILLKERPEQDDSAVPSVPAPEQPQQPVPVPEPRQPQVSPPPPAPKTHTITIHEQTVQTPAHVDGRLVLGIREMATLPNLNLKMEAKLDTGAENSSVDARNIQFFERDGKKWVKFDLPRTSEGTLPLELPLKGTIKIKRPGLSSVERPVVMMTITIGDITQSVPVSLINRSKFTSLLLIGRSFMQDLAIIDVNQQEIATKGVIRNRKRQAVVPVAQKSHTKAIIKPVSVEGLATLGAVEHMALTDHDMVLNARIDTGARTSSIDARDITFFVKDEKDWVSFGVPNAAGEIVTMEEPVTRFVMIKRHGEESEKRPVVTLNARIGDILAPTQFTLRNRESYEYPVLIGARFLENRALVDVSREYVNDKQQH